MSGATDIIDGRRGGRRLGHHPGRLLAEIRAVIARARAEGWEPPDLSRLFHPETIATTRAHERHCGAHAHPQGGAHAHPQGEACPARAEPADLADIWAGRARMAAARRAAGRPLDDLDRQALARLDDLGADSR